MMMKVCVLLLLTICKSYVLDIIDISLVNLLLVYVSGCPYLQQPSSLNVSDGSIVTFKVIVCNGSSNVNVFWAIGIAIYPPGYNFDGISVTQTTFTNGSVQSVLTFIANYTLYNNAEIGATVYTPQATVSNGVFLRIQGI